MSEKTAKKKLPLSVVWKLLIMAIGYNGPLGIVYLVGNYYVLYQAGTGLSDVQLGAISSVVGITAVVGMFFGGVLSDIFSPKKLLLFAYAITAAGGLFLMTMPPYTTQLIIFAALGIGCMMPYWCAQPKFMATLADPSLHGMLWGLYASLMAIMGLGVGVITGLIAEAGSARVGVRGMIIFFICESIVAFIGTLFIKGETPEAPAEKKEKKQKFNWAELREVLREPDVWLSGLACTAAYLGAVGNVYMNSAMTNYLGVGAGVTTIISSIGNYGFRLIGATFFGMMIDRITARKTLTISLVAMMAAMSVFVFIPYHPGYAALAIAAVLVFTLFFRLSGQSFNPLFSQNEKHIPYRLRGTAFSITAVLQGIPDCFMYSLAGNIITKYGIEGYKMLFLGLLAAKLVGLVAIVTLSKRVNKPGRFSETA